ncbi:MAG: ribonuclease HI family protein [Bacillota bacterium]
MQYIINVDGASRGNPGPAAAGIVLEPESGDRREIGIYLGQATNNVAEYVGAIVGLKLALKAGATQVVLRSDSELLVRQISGQYAVKAGHLRGLFMSVKGMLAQFREYSCEHVPRAENSAADALANAALDAAAAVPNLTEAGLLF